MSRESRRCKQSEVGQTVAFARAFCKRTASSSERHCSQCKACSIVVNAGVKFLLAIMDLTRSCFSTNRTSKSAESRTSRAGLTFSRVDAPQSLPNPRARLVTVSHLKLALRYTPIKLVSQVLCKYPGLTKALAQSPRCSPKPSIDLTSRQGTESCESCARLEGSVLQIDEVLTNTKPERMRPQPKGVGLHT